VTAGSKYPERQSELRWSESIHIDRDPETVFAAMLDQHTVIKWSAWPEATGYRCAVAGDGKSVGSEIVFADPSGNRMGRQRITEVGKSVVHNQMRNRGPAGRWVEPTVDFRVEQDGDGTRAYLDFEVAPPAPRLLLPFAHRYLKKSIRPLHVEDLRRLKRLLEEG
jgi:carbon monoxide dehydrogenase subunit G